MVVALPNELTADDRRIVLSLATELQPLAVEHWQMMRERGLRLQFNSGRRSAAQQAGLVADSTGRTVEELRAIGLSGFAAPSNSLHLDGLAYDGEPSPKTDATWQVYGLTAEAVGLEWGGRWSKTLADGTVVTDRPHVQLPRGQVEMGRRELAGAAVLAGVLVAGAALLTRKRGSLE